MGEGGDAGVAAGRRGGGGTAEAVGEGGEEQEAAGGERIAPRARDAHVGEAAGGADNDGRRRGRGKAGKRSNSGQMALITNELSYES